MVDSVSQVMQIVNKAAASTRKRRLIPALVLLNMKNTFNSITGMAVSEALKIECVEPCLHRVIQEYLLHRRFYQL